MKKFTITNGDNSKLPVDLVRYFKFKNDCFLIYTIGEVDEKNYSKLYLVRIMEELGFPVVQTIKNEADWKNMQNVVKEVLKELKKNKKKTFEDLNYMEIDGIKVSDPRFFKLDSKLVEILASNYLENEDVSNQEQVIQNIDPVPVLDSYDQSSQNLDDSLNDSAQENSVSSEIQSIQEAIPVDQPIDVQGGVNLTPSVPEVEQVDSVGQTMIVQNSENVESNITVNYKELYEALKSDNDATNELLDSVIVELNKYKEKYGEL